MSYTQNKIPVYFVIRNIHNPRSDYRAKLGEISIEQLGKLLSMWDKNAPSNDSCIHQMTIQYIDQISFGRIENNMENTRRLEFHSVYRDFNAPCMMGNQCQNTSQISIQGQCAQRLRNGKCQDAYLRRTLGAILFPQLYSNEKQKTK